MPVSPRWAAQRLTHLTANSDLLSSRGRKEAVKAVIDYCFQELAFDYLTCGHFDRNDRSRRVVEKSGFRFLKKVVTPTARGVDEPGKMYVLYNPMKPIDKEKQPCLN